MVTGGGEIEMKNKIKYLGFTLNSRAKWEKEEVVVLWGRMELNSITVKPLFNESLGIGFSYIKSRFLLNGGYAKFSQKLFFFFLIIYLLNYMISLYW
jgi:hypothetical protein